MSTRITNLIRERLCILAMMQVSLRALQSDLGKQIAEAHEDLRIKLIATINTIFPVKEMAILKKWDRGSTCEAVQINLARLKTKDNYDPFTVLLFPFDLIMNYCVRGEFYEKLFNNHKHPDVATVQDDKIYAKAYVAFNKFIQGLPTLPHGYYCGHNELPGVGHDNFNGLYISGEINVDTNIVKAFDPMLNELNIFRSMLKDLNTEIDDKYCPYMSLIKGSKNLEAISKFWPDAKTIHTYLIKTDEKRGTCKVMDVEEASMRIREDLAA